MSSAKIPYYQSRLKTELEKRIKKNSRYSLRAFATALDIPAGALSAILSGKRAISTKVIDKIFSVVEFSESEKKQFLESVLGEKESQGLKRVSPRLQEKLQSTKTVAKTMTAAEMDAELFRVVADWYHFAILELTHSPKFDERPRWLSRLLGISELEAKEAVERLMKLGLLEKKDGKFYATNVKMDTKDKTKTSLFHRKRQKQILEKSIYALENDPIEMRNHTGLTLCIDPKNLPEVKTRIQEVLWELAEKLITGKREEVYELTISLIPLSRRTTSPE